MASDDHNTAIERGPRKYLDVQRFAGDVETDDGTTIIDSSAGQVPDEALESTPAQVIESGNVTLASGAATIDTGVSVSDTATFDVALGPATNDAEITASILSPSGGNYTIHLDEINTSVGNPTVEYDVVRIR